MRHFNRTPALLSVLSALLLLLASGCAKDLTVDEWRKEKVNQELAQIRQVAGVYSGKLRAAEMGTMPARELGEVELTLVSDTRVSERGDRPGAERQAVIRGHFVIYSDQQRLIDFEGGSFDSTDGSFKAEARVTDTAGQAVIVSFTGRIEGTHLSGKVEVVGRSESALFFELERGALLVGPQASPTPPQQSGDARTGIDAPAPPGPPRTDRDAVLTYRGTASWLETPRVRPMEVIILRNALNTDQEFIDFLNPVQWVNVTLNFDFGTPEQPLFMPFFFEQSQWDRRLGTLRGSLVGTNPNGMDRYKLSFTCAITAQDLNCDYVSAYQGRLLTIRASRVGEPPSKARALSGRSRDSGDYQELGSSSSSTSSGSASASASQL